MQDERPQENEPEGAPGLAPRSPEVAARGRSAAPPPPVGKQRGRRPRDPLDAPPARAAGVATQGRQARQRRRGEHSAAGLGNDREVGLARGRQIENHEVGGVVVAVHVGELARQARAGRRVGRSRALAGEYLAGLEAPVADRVDDLLPHPQHDRVGPVLEVEFRRYEIENIKYLNRLSDIWLCR